MLGPMDAVRYANVAIRFTLEMAALVALGYWGFSQHDGVAAVLLGLGAPALGALAWGLFVAPKARVDLPPGGRLVLEAVVFAAAALALADAGHSELAVVIAVAAVISRTLLAALGDPAGMPVHRV
jgi:hypothetical protein